jgi:hypothetical protein
MPESQTLTERTLDQPLDLEFDQSSGCPITLLEQVRANGRLVALDRVLPVDVLVEFPFGSSYEAQTGFKRFVRLRNGRYALVREAKLTPGSAR